MEVISATDVGVGDRGFVRGAGSMLAIQTILQNWWGGYSYPQRHRNVPDWHCQKSV